MKGVLPAMNARVHELSWSAVDCREDGEAAANSIVFFGQARRIECFWWRKALAYFLTVDRGHGWELASATVARHGYDNVHRLEKKMCFESGRLSFDF